LVVSAETQAVPKAKARNAALDRARTFITVLMLIQHSVIAYTYYGGKRRRSTFSRYSCASAMTVQVFSIRFAIAPTAST
jgi:uncharacterized membrane protein